MQLVEYIDFNAVTSVLIKNPTMQHLFLSITDINGNMLSSTGWRRACRDFHRVNKNSKDKCTRSDIELANQLNAGEQYALYTCFNGLTEAATPFIVDGEHIGNLIAGQVFLKPPDIDFFIQQADQFGFNKDEYIQAIKEVPVVDETELRRIMVFYSELTTLLGSMAQQAHQYKVQTDKLSIRTAELEYVNSELEAFSYSVSHDLRAPLRHIMGFIELFNKKFSHAIPEQGRHYFDVIYDSTQSMSVLIDELLQFSRNGRAELMQTDVSMNDIVADEIKILTEGLKSQRNIQWRIGALAPAHCDKEMFKLVWRNLIDNAVKFTQKKPEAVIEIGCYDENGQTVYFIRDNGAGFDMKYSQKLFGVFQRMHTSEEFNGTGIGLATVKRIISRHGGRIWADAQPENGAAFYFTLSRKGN
jgi:signal transduction histidine kinase